MLFYIIFTLNIKYDSKEICRLLSKGRTRPLQHTIRHLMSKIRNVITHNCTIISMNNVEILCSLVTFTYRSALQVYNRPRAIVAPKPPTLPNYDTPWGHKNSDAIVARGRCEFWRGR